MITGIGTDLCDITRIARLYQKYGERFVARILTPNERRNLVSIPYLASRFAAKEACAKALGTGIRAGVGFQQIEIEKRHKQPPAVELKGSVLEEFGHLNIHLSISHERHYALAMVVAEEK